MDSEELDRWLDADLTADGDDGAEIAWSGDARRNSFDGATSPEVPARRRRPWAWIAGVGLIGWLAVMAVLASGDGEPAAEMSDLGTEGPDAAGFIESVPTPEPTTAPTVAASTTADVESSPDGSAAVAPATAALRARLTTSEPRASYLEWATVVEVIPMGAGIELVVMDAIWLEGDDPTSLDQAHQANWAVPVADDGQVLASPWPHTPAPQQERESPPPPVGTVRIGEVAQAIEAAGWTDASVIGSDPHPLLPDAIVALVEGVPPGGGDVIAEVVWLQDDETGLLQVPGAGALPSEGMPDEGTPDEETDAATAAPTAAEKGL